MSKRLITFMATLALSLSAVGITGSLTIGVDQIISPSGGTGGDNCGVRRTTGIGGTKQFCKGESVDGAVITFNSGKTYYGCHIRHAPRSGKVENGVIRYFRAEVATPLCKNTLSSPGPRNPTGEGNWGNFDQGDHVLGFAIEINVGPDGRTYFGCAIVRADASGRMNSGVVNPSRFEIRDMVRRCGSTDNWNPGFRTESGNGGTIRFVQGDRILAAFIKYDNGVERFTCFDRVADMDGSLTSGVRNYWPGEDNNLTAC